MTWRRSPLEEKGTLAQNADLAFDLDSLTLGLFAHGGSEYLVEQQKAYSTNDN